MKKTLQIFNFSFVLIFCFSLLFLTILIPSQLAMADNGEGFEIITCGRGEDGALDCDFEDLKTTVGNVFRYLLEWVILPVATTVLIWSGFNVIWKSSKGEDPSFYRQVLKNVVIGIALAVGAYALVRTFITLFFNDEGAFQEVIKSVFSGG